MEDGQRIFFRLRVSSDVQSDQDSFLETLTLDFSMKNEVLHHLLANLFPLCQKKVNFSQIGLSLIDVILCIYHIRANRTPLLIRAPLCANLNKTPLFCLKSPLFEQKLN